MLSGQKTGPVFFYSNLPHALPLFIIFFFIGVTYRTANCIKRGKKKALGVNGV